MSQPRGAAGGRAPFTSSRRPVARESYLAAAAAAAAAAAPAASRTLESDANRMRAAAASQRRHRSQSHSMSVSPKCLPIVASDPSSSSRSNFPPPRSRLAVQLSHEELLELSTNRKQPHRIAASSLDHDSTSCRRRRQRQHRQILARLPTRGGGSAHMRPNWRQLALLGLVSLAAASLLMNLSLINPSQLIISQCHALNLNASQPAATTTTSTSAAPAPTLTPTTTTTTTTAAAAAAAAAKVALVTTFAPVRLSQAAAAANSPVAGVNSSSAAAAAAAAAQSSIRAGQLRQLSAGQTNRTSFGYPQAGNLNNGNHKSSSSSSSSALAANNNQPLGDNNARKASQQLQLATEATDIRPQSLLASSITAGRDSSWLKSRAKQQQPEPSVPTSAEREPKGALKVIASPSLAAPPPPPQFASSGSGSGTGRQQQPSQRQHSPPVAGWTIASEQSDKQSAPPLPPPPPIVEAGQAIDGGPQPAVLFDDSATGSSRPMRRQFVASPLGGAGLVLPHAMLHSLVREALGELVASAASAGQLRQSTANQNQPHWRANPSQSNGGGGGQQQLESQSAANSQSAPSVSLPPLSHFLVPRNPFRLFSSSSAPGGLRQQQQQHHFQAESGGGGEQTSASRPHMVGLTMAASAPVRMPFGQPVVWPSPSWVNEVLASALSSQQGSVQAAASTANKLYAHSHSAEQLEQLIRAAGLRGPAILPAIVSAPNGPLPGFYIPAIESEAQNQAPAGTQLAQASNTITSSSSSSSSGGSGGAGAGPTLGSRIPGTDYILHPDEVRAMIGIGELAWRQQQRQQAGKNSQPNSRQQQQQQQRAASESSWSQMPASSQPLRMRPFEQALAAANLMQEDHAQNARDFAYVDPTAGAGATNNRLDQSAAAAAAMRLNTSELESRLVQHFAHTTQQQQQQQTSPQQQASSFPAMIRVNDQDYVHWPLAITGNGEPSPATATVDAMRTSAASQRPWMGPQLYHQQPFYRQAIHLRPIQFQSVGNRFHHHNQRQQQQQESQASQEVVRPDSQAAGAATAANEPDTSPARVRLATQLTPLEIRQVEESIIEALVMTQALQNQQRLVRIAEAQARAQAAAAAAAASSNRPTSVRLSASGKPKSATRGGFFGLRRRRHSASSSSSASSGGLSTPTRANHSQQLRGDASTLHHWSLLAPPQLLMLPAAAAVAPAMPIEAEEEPDEPLMIESSSRQRFPVLLADQDTNRPTVGAQHSDGDQLELMAAASDPEPSRASGGGGFLMSPAERAEPVFGARLQSARARFGGGGGQQQQPQQQAATNHGLRAATNQFQQHQRQPYRVGLADPAKGESRINVDWPAMVSDADYFPANSHQANQPREVAARAAASVDDRPGLNLNHWPSAPLGSGRDQAPSAGPARSASSWSPHALHEAAPAPNHQVFTGSQLRLQFSPDYQAREGVPIYNNNVRAAGVPSSPVALL